MFNFSYKNRIPIDEKMRHYCMKSTKESIRKMTEKYEGEKKLNNTLGKKNILFISNDLFTPPPPPPNNDLIIPIIFFLSTSTIIYYFYKVSTSKYVFFY